REVLRDHDGMEFDPRVEREEPWLGDRGDLRCVLHLEEDERGTLTVVVREVRRLRFLLREDRLNGCAELAGLRGRIAGLDGNVDLHEESHRDLLSVGGGRLTGG